MAFKMLLVVLATLRLTRLSPAAPSPSPAPDDFLNSTEEQHLTALESQLSSLNDSLVVGNVPAVTLLIATFVATSEFLPSSALTRPFPFATSCCNPTAIVLHGERLRKECVKKILLW